MLTNTGTTNNLLSRACNTLPEYGGQLLSPTVSASFYEEYYELMIADRAVSILKNYG